MQIGKYKPYLISVLIAEAVGALSGLLSMSGMQAYNTFEKSALTPPAVVFPIVWTVLYALMGIGAARVFVQPQSDERSRALWTYAAQLVVNFFWSLIFFNLQAFGLAFFWLILLWALIVLMIVFFYQVDKTAALLQIPYLLWVTFAGYLTYMAWMLN